MFDDVISYLEIYDIVTIIYVIVGIASLIWASIGNNYVYGLIEKKESNDINKINQSDIYFIELRKSWLREQNIWKSVEYFLIGLSYLSMVVTIYMAVDNVLEADILTIKITFYTIINLLSSAFKDYLVPDKKAIGLRKAYILLNEAILNYEYGFIDLEELNKSVRKGEDIITEYVYED